MIIHISSIPSERACSSYSKLLKLFQSRRKQGASRAQAGRKRTFNVSDGSRNVTGEESGNAARGLFSKGISWRDN